MKKIYNRYRWEIIICFVLIGLGLTVFGQVINYDFVNYDDRDYVTKNVRVQAGWTFDSMLWALKAKTHGHWHPLTWLSHMTDCQLFGLNPGRHHLTSLLIHLASTLLLFGVFSRMTGAVFRSAFVAALFAVHPLHVEPVAWIAARKDLLSAFFWMLCLGTYFYYVKRPGWFRYLLILVAFVLGLMSKPMIVTLPLVLLLLDYWPLRRWPAATQDGRGGSAEPKSGVTKSRMRLGLRLLAEKFLFFILLGGSAFITVLFMRYETLPTFSLSKILPKAQFFAQAVVFYAHYIIKLFWPFGLATPYPQPGVPPVWQVAGAVVLLAVISAGAARWQREKPYLLVGWLWYLVTLLPVIGLVKFGPHTIADRYTYISLIGLFIMIAWGVPDLMAGRRRQKLISGVAAGAFLTYCLVLSIIQTSHWQNSVTLMSHNVAVTDNNWLAHSNLGVALKDAGRIDEAIVHYKQALRINPKDFRAYTNLGYAKMIQGKHQEGGRYFSQALKANPDDPQAHYALGLILKDQGNCEEAIRHFIKSLRVNPGNAKAHFNLGLCLSRGGNHSQAVRHFSKVLEIEPAHVGARMNLGISLMKVGRRREAINHFRQALRLNPDDAKAHYILGSALNREGSLEEAAGHLARSLQIKPGNPQALNQIGIVLAKRGDLDGAVRHFSEALKIDPENPMLHMNLGLAFKNQGRMGPAIKHFSEVLRIQPGHDKARQELELAQRRLEE